jgi:hypothetical protein
LLFIELSSLSGCHRSNRSGQIAQVYQDAQTQFEQGDLIDAFQKSDAAYKELSERNPEWSWRFRVLAAEVLVWRGLSLPAPRAFFTFRVFDRRQRRPQRNRAGTS